MSSKIISNRNLNQTESGRFGLKEGLVTNGEQLVTPTTNDDVPEFEEGLATDEDVQVARLRRLHQQLRDSNTTLATLERA